MTANTAAYSARRRAAIAAGTWHGRDSGDAARARLRALRAAGVSHPEVARAAGIAVVTVRRCANGGGIDGATSDAILAVTAERVASRRVHSGGTVLRLRALAARGWSPSRVARWCGLPLPYVRDVTAGNRPEVPRAVRNIVATAYEALWDREPPALTSTERRAASAARGRAERRGWQPPAGLDDDLLDMPGYKPPRRFRDRAAA